MLGLTAVEIGLSLVIVFAGAALQGAVGLGFALVSAPLLALIEPALAPQAILGTGGALSLLIAFRERQAIVATEIGWALAGYLPGALLAAALVARLPTGTLSLLFAALVLLGVALTALRLRLRVSARTLWPAGILSGFMGTISSIGGPPLALLYQHRRGAQLRSTLGLYFAGGSILSIAVLALGGHFDTLDLARNLLLLPGVLLGFALSGRFIAILDRGPLRPLILTVCALSALMVIARTLALF